MSEAAQPRPQAAGPAGWLGVLSALALVSCAGLAVRPWQHEAADLLGCARERVVVSLLRDGRPAAWRAAGCDAELTCGPGASGGAELDCVKAERSGAPVAAPAPQGDRSGTGPEAGGLAIPVRFPGSVELLRRGGLGGGDQVTATVRVPAGAPSLEGTLLLWDKEGHWWQGAPRPFPAPPGGGEIRLTFDVLQAQPVDHLEALQRHRLADVDHVGVRLSAAQAWAGWIGASPLSVGQGALPPLAIERIRLPDGPVARYGIAQLEVELSRAFSNPFDPAEIDLVAEITTPPGRQLVQPGFFSQDYLAQPGGGASAVGPGLFRVRFSPREAGPHAVRIVVRAGGETVEGPWQAIEVVDHRPPRQLLPIRIGPDGLGFETAAGEPFYPIGHNLHSPRPLLDPTGPPLAQDGLTASVQVFDRMAAAGENLTEVWMSPWWLGLEWSRAWAGYHGLGRYHLEHAWMLDAVLEAAARRGLYVHLVLDNHGVFSSFCDEEWSSSPYQLRNGGALASPDEFFTDPAAFAAYRNRLRYVLARWGAYSNVLGLELVSELDLTGSRQGAYRRPEVLDWLRRATRYLRETDAHGHLLTVHFSGDYRRVAPRIARDDSIDYLTVDAYRDRAVPFAVLAQRTAEALVRYRKPFLVTEYGSAPGRAPPRPAPPPGAEPELVAELRAGLWSSWLTPAAGAPLFWWFDLVHKRDLYRTYTAFRSFTEGESRASAASYQTTVQGAGHGVEVMLFGDARAGWGWAYHDAEMSTAGPPSTRPPVSVSLPALGGARYRVEYWDTSAGRLLGSDELLAGDDGRLGVVLPAFRADLAFKWRALPGPAVAWPEALRDGPR